MPSRQSALRWSCLTAVLAGIGSGLHWWLPPQPRWSLTGRHHLCHLFSDGSLVAAWDDFEIQTEHLPAPEHHKRDVDVFVVGKGPLLLREARTGMPVRTLFRDTTMMHRCDFTPDHRHAVAQFEGKPVRVAEVATGREWAIDMQAPSRHRIGGPTFPASGEFMFVPPDHKEDLAIVNLRTGEKQDLGFKRDIYGRDRHWGADGNLFISHVAGDLLVWDARTRRQGALWKGVLRGKISPDGRSLAVAVAAGDAAASDKVMLLDLPELVVRGEVPVDCGPRPGYSPVGLEFSSDSQMLALWYRAKNARIVEFWETASCARLGTANAFDGENGSFSPDGRRFWLGNWSELEMYDATTGRLLSRWMRNGHGRTGPVFSADGQRLVDYSDRHVEWRDAATLQMVASTAVPAFTGPDVSGFDGDLVYPRSQVTPDHRRLLIRGAAFMPDPSRLQKALQAWLPGPWFRDTFTIGKVLAVVDVDSVSVLLSLDGVHCIDAVLSDDGQTLVTVHEEAGGQRTLRCWDVSAPTRWQWVVGLPLALLGLCLVAARRKRRQRPSQRRTISMLDGATSRSA